MLLLLLATFGQYNFAEESSKSKSQVEDLTFNAYLAVKGIEDNGLVLILNDGSEWDIKYFGEFWGWFEQKEVTHWTIGDIIEIQYPGSGNWTDFFLVINNLSKNQKALAYLKHVPSIDYSTCLWVMNFDEDTNRVTLNDGTVWFKSTTDMYDSAYNALSQERALPQSKWEIGDPLTLIRGEGWLNANSFLLWNHSINTTPCVNRLE